jgi:hypothetical protein
VCIRGRIFKRVPVHVLKSLPSCFKISGQRFRICDCASADKEVTSSLMLLVLRFKLDGGEPNLFALWVGIEGLSQHITSSGNVSSNPFFLCPHQPQRLRLWTMLNGSLQHCIDRVSGSVSFFQLCGFPLQILAIREDLEGVGEDCSSNSNPSLALSRHVPFY